MARSTSDEAAPFRLGELHMTQAAKHVKASLDPATREGKMRAIILLLAAALCGGSVHAQVPHKINYQGI